MAGCNLVVIPTLTDEPLANVVLESKQAGLAAIIFPSGGLPETIEHGVDGFICRDKSVESLTEGLRFYLAAPDKIVAQGSAARASLAKFQISDFSENWWKIYVKSLNSRRSSIT
jgi:glycosyltransferase involved in cell wall biosynthesis